MNRYVKISAALAAFALLLVVMGLSTQSVVQAAPGDITFANDMVDTDRYVCSSCVLPLNRFTVTIENNETGTLKATNLDVARVTDVNPKPINSWNSGYRCPAGLGPHSAWRVGPQ